MRIATGSLEEFQLIIIITSVKRPLYGVIKPCSQTVPVFRVVQAHDMRHYRTIFERLLQDFDIHTATHGQLAWSETDDVNNSCCPERLFSQVTYNVLMVTLNPTHSFIHSLTHSHHHSSTEPTSQSMMQLIKPSFSNSLLVVTTSYPRCGQTIHALSST